MTRKLSSVLWVAFSLLLIMSIASWAADAGGTAPTVTWDQIAAPINTIIITGSTCGSCSSCFIVGEACDFNGWKGKCASSGSQCSNSEDVMCYCKGPTSIEPGPLTLATACAAK